MAAVLELMLAEKLAGSTEATEGSLKLKNLAANADLIQEALELKQPKESG